MAGKIGTTRPVTINLAPLRQKNRVAGRRKDRWMKWVTVHLGLIFGHMGKESLVQAMRIAEGTGDALKQNDGIKQLIEIIGDTAGAVYESSLHPGSWILFPKRARCPTRQLPSPVSALTGVSGKVKLQPAATRQLPSRPPSSRLVVGAKLWPAPALLTPSLLRGVRFLSAILLDQ